jgi:Fe-S cluster assembly protein SufD
MLFYLRSRGIPLEDARTLLIESFVGEALDKIEDERLREALSAMARARLAGLAA